jgi:hypothetical protein
MFARIAGWEIHFARDYVTRTTPEKSYWERAEDGGVDALFLGHILVVSKAVGNGGWELEALGVCIGSAR